MKPFQHSTTRIALIVAAVAAALSLDGLLSPGRVFNILSEGRSDSLTVGLASLCTSIILPLGGIALVIVATRLSDHKALGKWFVILAAVGFAVPFILTIWTVSIWGAFGVIFDAFQDVSDYTNFGLASWAALAAMIVYLAGAKKGASTQAWSATDSLSSEAASQSGPIPAVMSKAPRAGFKGFMASLLDHRLENFISRKVAGVMYIVVAWLIIVFGVLLVLGSLYQITQGYGAAIFSLLLSPLVTLLMLVIVRMAFESGVALIVVAENTKK